MGFLNSSGLERFLGKIQTLLSKKVDVNQGARNEGCYLVVDEDGDLVLEDVPATVSVPDELDRIGRVRVTTANAADAEFDFTLLDEDVGLEPGDTYVGSVHLYMPGSEYVSNLDFCEYLETYARTDAMVFSNMLVIGTTAFRFLWILDPEEETVRVMTYAGENFVRLDTMFTGNGITRVEFIVRHAQVAPY